MTDFQIGLVVIGGVAIAGVLIYNRMQERRTRRQTEAYFTSRHADTLLEDAATRRDPPLASEGERAPGEMHGAPGASAASAAPATPVAPVLPDETIDYVIDVFFATPVSGASWVEAWQPLARRLKPWTTLAASADGAGWEAIGSQSVALQAVASQAESWPHYRAGMQLVSRAGPAAEADVLEFRSAVEGIAAALGGTVQPTDARRAITHAHDLDRFCAESDIQIAFHVVAPATTKFPTGEIQRAAEAIFMEQTASGFRRLDARGREWFSISAEAGQEGSRLTFALDVPRAADAQGAFRAMIAGAQTMRAALGGALVDDNAAALDERGLEAIWQSVEPIIRSLEARGVAPGSALALRLFS